MGNGGAKQTNKMLNAQTSLMNQQAGTMGNRSEAEYAGRSGLRGQINDKLWELMGNAPTTSGGSAGKAAGWAGQPYEEIYKGYGDLGSYWSDPTRKSMFMSDATAPIAGMYAGMKNNMARANNATGGYFGYNSQNKDLLRNTAREGSAAGLKARNAIEGLGYQGLSDSLAGKLSTANAGWREAQAGSSGSAGGPGTQDYYLKMLMGQQGEYNDLPYAQLNQSGLNSGLNAINSRKDETPGWQKALMSVGPSAISAGLGAFSGGSKKKKPGQGSFGDEYGNW